VVPEPAAAHADQSRQPVPEFPLDPSRDDDYVVRVVTGEVSCSGTLIYEDRVLTAHHCVAARNTLGEALARDAAPNEIRIELGGDYMPWGEVGVKVVVAPPCGHDAGDGDIAILVLERGLVGMPTLSPRLDRAPRVGEPVRSVGFGRCALSGDGIRRHSRNGGNVDRVSVGHFRLRASICPGDSGGPVVTPDGDLVGVVSASVMDGSDKTAGTSEFTRVDHWRPVFATAKLIVEGASPAEVPPLSCAAP
jgi:V8-like Glu-specific endopeptidase